MLMQVRRMRWAADVLGYLATVAFFAQYLPQMKRNYDRQSTEGFSVWGVGVKLVGAAFMFANYLLEWDEGWVVLYGLINMFQYMALIAQDVSYMKRSSGAWLLLVPAPIFVFSLILPWSRSYTTGFKPLTQIISHLFFLYECVKLRTTAGISLSSQMLNLAGGVAGLVACILVTPRSPWTIYLYTNSILQALSIFFLRCLYGPPQLATHLDGVV